jgi:hypothetical protein
LERHRKSRIFQGKLTELLAADWLEDQRWTIEHLEALSGQFDIEAKSPDNISYAIEVKYIGQEDIRYKEMVRSLSSGNAIGGSWSVYDGYNFILFKAYEAAKQLLNCDKERLGFIIISNIAWDFVEVPIKDKWFYNRPFIFSGSASSEWNDFLRDKKKENKFSNIESDLDKIIGQIKELWIIEEENYLNYLLQDTIKIKNRN